METILVIEFMILLGVLIIGFVSLIVTDIKEAIKKHKEEKKSFNKLNKF